MNERDEPHVKRRGWLRNGNPPGDFSMAPRCGAKARHGGSCRAPGMQNGRCRLHGGKSTGPRTLAGKKRSANANWRHGEYSKESYEFREDLINLLKSARFVLKDMGND